MRRALALAQSAEGRTAPNPMVGCVIVRDDSVVAEGFHEGAGRPHAEAVALAKAGPAARGATAYVTLEPCAHYGRTPPCAQALINAGIAETIFAMADPNPAAAGGARALEAAGVRVRGGLLADEAARLNRAWLHVLREGRPRVIAKAALSLDGRIATVGGDSKWITGEEARADAHRLRAACDAIAVGAGTVIADDPALTARIGDETRQPLRVIFDGAGRTSPGAQVYDRSGRGALLLARRDLPMSRRRAFEAHGVDVALVDADPRGRIDITAALKSLSERNIMMLMVEGGGALLGAFHDADAIDELHLYFAPLLLGGGVSAFAGSGVQRVVDARRFDFARPAPIGRDFVVRGVRRRGTG